MKIAHVIWTKFPVQGYGGTERLCYWLAKAQAEMGHQVTVLCLEGSELPFASTVAIPSHIEDLDPFLPSGTDIVQTYGTPNYKISVPYLVNIGGNGKPGEIYPANTVFVSKDHAQRHAWTEYVHNGIDLSEYPLKKRKGSFLLFLAKASWKVKNLKGAIRIAQKAEIPLHVAGGRAACWHRGVISHGLVDGQKKIDLLQNALGLLFPIIWNEPFGLAVVEALACGNPVVATPRGALPEIVDNTCGVLGDSFDALVEGCRKMAQFSPEACRHRAEHFSHLNMAEKYLYYYKKILSDGCIREGQPITPMSAAPEQKILYSGY